MKCFFGHKWDFYQEPITFKQVSGDKTMTLNGCEIRRCSTCGKKQYRVRNAYDVWNNAPLTKSDIRDSKINNILK